MLVYGDSYTTERLGVLIERLAARTQAICGEQAPSLDALRALLIRAGELEQAAADELADSASRVEPFHRVTARAAEAFFALWQNKMSRALEALKQIAPLLDSLNVDHERAVKVKVPEGFAYYALYPEQYILAAQRWLADHSASAEKEVVVVGVRSVGTTLAALVTAVLCESHCKVRSLTVRPTGHPFERRVTLEGARFSPSTWALVVDEGPGISGSSMASTAQALVTAGIAGSRISFLPGHGGSPGSAASEQVREWWANVPRYVQPLGDVRFDGLTLPEALKAATHALYPNDPVLQIEDFSAGLWRGAIYRSERDYPAVCARFERPKYRCITRSGTRILWKFAGLASAPSGEQTSAEAEAALLAERAKLGYGVPVVGEAHGFVATQWINGKRLSYADASPEIAAHVGRYVAAAAGEPLTGQEQEAAQVRLHDMLYWNTWELLGEELAEKTRQWREIDAPTLGYGDGHLAPHEWIRTTDGKFWKSDSTGHDRDHTFIGRQSILWDVAGGLVEWGLSHPAELVAAFTAESGIQTDGEALAFYRAAYAAFRAGQCALCAEEDAAEAPRLERAVTFYRDQLRRLLP